MYSSISDNNGIMGYTKMTPTYRVNEEIPFYIVFGDHTRSFNIANTDFCVMDNVKVLKPLRVHTLKQLIFVISSWKNGVVDKGYSRHWSIAKEVGIQLPIKNGKIDFEFMDAYISELEEERISELAAYLKVSGLDNYELSSDEKQALEKFEQRVDSWNLFKIQSVFDVKSSKKRFDANKVEILHQGYPYVVRMSADNGVKGYLKQDEEFLNQGNTIAFGQDTATMFYQENPYFTGDKIKVLECKYNKFDKINAMFLISAMKKSFSTFSWGANSFSEKAINTQEIQLPIKNNEIDFSYMNTLVSAVQKLVIKDVVLWADKKIYATKKVINKN